MLLELQHSNETLSNGILLDCDTEFIHFSENFDASVGSDDDTFAILENYQPSVVHKEFAAQLDQLKSSNESLPSNDLLHHHTSDDLLHQSQLLKTTAKAV